jgi:hypothetical protein
MRDGRMYTTRIDEEDAEKALSLHGNWYVIDHDTHKRRYVAVTVGHSKDPVRTVYLHRHLIDAPEDMVVDHINGDTLDNRRSCNLRVVTESVNNLNRHVLHPRNRSGVRGVYWDASKKCFRARVNVDRHCNWLGTFKSAAEAGVVVQAFLKKLGVPTSTSSVQV